MRKWLLAGLMGVALAGPALAQELPNFTFRDATAGAVVDLKEFGRCEKPDQRGVVACLDNETHVAGEPAEWVIAMLHEGRVTDVGGKFKTGSFGAIAKAFDAKYGKPCETEVRDWQSVMGAKAQGAILTWCFRSGKLKLEQIGGNLSSGRFTYVDDHRPPLKEPKVDF